MSLPNDVSCRHRCTDEELERRLLFVAKLRDAEVSRWVAVALTMRAFQVSRRLAQMYVRRVFEPEDPVTRSVRDAKRLMRVLEELTRASPRVRSSGAAPGA